MTPVRAVSVAEAADALGVSERRVRQLIDAGRVPGAERIGGVWLIPTDKDGRPKIELRGPGRPAKKTK